MASYQILSHQNKSSMEVEFYWKISNWKRRQLSSSLMMEQRKVIEVGSSRLEFNFRESSARSSMMCLKVLELTDAEEATVSTTVELVEHGDVLGPKSKGLLVLNVKLAAVDVGVDLAFDYDENAPDLMNYMNANDELEHKIKVKFDYKRAAPPKPPPKFEIPCMTRRTENWEALMRIGEFQNFKIITQDDREFFVHKHLLSTRCPVFESMFRSNLEKAKTGQLHVKDVSGAAMEILIKFWYSGKLAENWKDPAVVVDFTRAVGKYRISELLEFLDTELGNEDVVQSSLELAEMAQKLELKVAEKNLRKNMAKKATGAKNIEDLCAALGLSAQW